MHGVSGVAPEALILEQICCISGFPLLLRLPEYSFFTAASCLFSSFFSLHSACFHLCPSCFLIFCLPFCFLTSCFACLLSFYSSFWCFTSASFFIMSIWAWDIKLNPALSTDIFVFLGHIRWHNRHMSQFSGHLAYLDQGVLSDVLPASLTVFI